MTDKRVLEQLSQLRQLHRLSVNRYRSNTELYNAYLRAGCHAFGLSLGIVSRIRGDDYEVLTCMPESGTIAAGSHFRLGETYCARVVETDTTVAVHHVGADPGMRNHPAYKALALEAYVGAPIHVRGEIFGTLNFSDSRPHTGHFTRTQLEFIQLMAETLGSTLERDLLAAERESAIARMEENVALFEGAFRHAGIGMALVGTDGTFLRVNDSLCDIVGYDEKELLRRDFQSITHPDDLDTDLAYMHDLLKSRRERYRMKKRYLRNDGTIVWIMLTGAVIRNSDGSARYFIAQIEDINDQILAEQALQERQRQLEEANSKLARLARTDPLTGLVNRRELLHRIDIEVQRAERTGRPLAAVVIDVDEFKEYNDLFGHPEGDRALSIIARTLEGVCRSSDVLARYGGEEFVALLPATDMTEALRVCERMRLAVVGLDSLNRRTTISLGIAACEPGQCDGLTTSNYGDILGAADRALYQAKHAGRNCIRQSVLAPAPA